MSEATDALRNRIVRGGYRSGEQLSERRIAKDLSFTIMPVRRAIAQLESEKLVIVQPQVGTFVHRPDQDEAVEIIKARLAIETWVARELAKQLANNRPKDDSKIKAAENLHEEMRRLASKKPYDHTDILKFAELDGEFHCALACCAGYANTLAPALLSLRNRFRLIALPSEQSFAKQTSREHGEILDAIRQAHGRGAAQTAADSAAAAVLLHIKKSVQRWRLQPEFADILTKAAELLGF